MDLIDLLKELSAKEDVLQMIGLDENAKSDWDIVNRWLQV